MPTSDKLVYNEAAQAYCIQDELYKPVFSHTDEQGKAIYKWSTPDSHGMINVPGGKVPYKLYGKDKPAVQVANAITSPNSADPIATNNTTITTADTDPANTTSSSIFVNHLLTICWPFVGHLLVICWLSANSNLLNHKKTRLAKNLASLVNTISVKLTTLNCGAVKNCGTVKTTF